LRPGGILKRLESLGHTDNFTFQKGNFGAKNESVRNFLCGFLSGIILCLNSNSFAQTPPPNDNFVNRIIVAGSLVTLTGTLANATIETNENLLSHAQVQAASVWWSWTADQSLPVTFEFLDPSTNDLRSGSLEVWTGLSFTNGLTLTAETSLDSGRNPFFTFTAIAGTVYHVRVVGPNYGDFSLKITETNIPLILIQPLHRSVPTNGSAFFGVVVAGINPISYQWRFNGTNLPGEIFPILSIDDATINQSGDYSVTVSNAGGTTISGAATLNVVANHSPPHLLASGGSDENFYFKIVGNPYRFYRIECSTNLSDWSEEESFRSGLVFNGTNFISIPRIAPEKFYRAIVYSPLNEVCINNLGKIRFAKEIWMLETTKMSGDRYPTMGDINPYLKDGVPFCPLDEAQCANCSYQLNTADQNPVCKIHVFHILEGPEY